eukprot:gb/GECG01008093.1/.p1 GENE.gb/GECG01008093.1/~~gb/GECG01008093.1/.p1  ORF type:complete len:116 (+),score=11.05 gb/GECG01008093.1/:1-348(+)
MFPGLSFPMSMAASVQGLYTACIVCSIVLDSFRGVAGTIGEKIPSVEFVWVDKKQFQGKRYRKSEAATIEFAAIVLYDVTSESFLYCVHLYCFVASLGSALQCLGYQVLSSTAEH